MASKFSNLVKLIRNKKFLIVSLFSFIIMQELIHQFVTMGGKGMGMHFELEIIL